MARHRDAAAIEKLSPNQADPLSDVATTTVGSGTRRIVRSAPTSSSSSVSAPGNAPREILIVASKLKNYIKARSDMSTSQSVMDVLSDKVRRLCDEAIDEARAQGRKTVLDRDFRK